MPSFPVSSSILSASHIAAFVQETYSLPAPVTARILRSGINDTYLITAASGKFVFRIYSLDWRTETEISEELRLLEHLRTHSIPVSYPIFDQNGHYLNELEAPEGKRMAVLFSFAEGTKISNLSAETHFTIGATMARLHAATSDFSLQRVTYTADVLIRQPMNRLEQFLPAATEEMQYMRRLETFLCEAFGQFDLSELRTGAVHLDIWFDNMNVREDGTATLFDFDFCGNGWLCHDVAYYLLQLSNVERDPLECEKKTNSFLAGYESLIELTAEERRILSVLGISTYCFYLGIQCQRFDNWSNVFLSEDYLKRFINGLVKRFANIHHLPV